MTLWLSRKATVPDRSKDCKRCPMYKGAAAFDAAAGVALENAAMKETSQLAA